MERGAGKERWANADKTAMIQIRMVPSQWAARIQAHMAENHQHPWGMDTGIQVLQSPVQSRCNDNDAADNIAMMAAAYDTSGGTKNRIKEMLHHGHLSETFSPGFVSVSDCPV